MDSLRLLKKFIKVDSSTIENANQLIKYTAEYLASNGVKGDIVEKNGFMSYVSVIGKGDKTLVFNGHLDIVSGKSGQFSPIEKDGKLYGRGTADMKSGCVAIIQAFIALSKMPLNCKVMLQLVTDEETGGANCTKYLVELGYLGDFVICTEPTQLQPSIQSKGMIKIDLHATGVSAHGSSPWEGENAIVKAFEAYEKIKALRILNEGSAFYTCSSVNLALIKGGDIYNRVPDHCVMGLDIRFVPHLDPLVILEKIKDAVACDVRLIGLEPGVLVSPEHPYISKLTECIHKIIPEQCINIMGQHGGSDARFFATRGIPSIELGPIGKAWHGDGEYVEIQSMIDLEKILIAYAQYFGEA